MKPCIRRLFRTPWLNGVAARVSGFLLFLPSTWFKYFHLAHHRFTQVPGKDPELATEKPKTRLGFVKHMSGVPTWIGHFKTLVQNATGDCSADFLPKKAEPSIVSESRLLILSYTLMFSGALFLGLQHCSGFGFYPYCWGSRSYAYTFWQNMDYAQRWQTYVTTHAQLSPIR